LAAIDSSASDSLEDCQLLSIVYRKKHAKGIMTNATNFIWLHDKFVKAKDVLVPDPCWTLYTLDMEFAYFLRMPKPWPHYHAREAPFVFMRQHEIGTKLARMPFKAFCRLAEQSLPEPKGPVVYYSSAARSGSTLLTRLVQVSEKRIISFSETDAFKPLTIFLQRGFISEDLVIRLLKSIFKFYCKTQEPGQTYLMKVASNACRLVPLVKKAMPKVKHMFTYRRNTRRVLSSVEKLIRGTTTGDVAVALWNISPEIPIQLLNSGAYEYEMFQRFGIEDCLDIAIIMHVASWYYYYRCRDIFDIPVIYYEDLIAEKEKTLRSVFEICELPYDESIGEAMKEFANDSQAGTALSQDNMKAVKDTPLDQSKVQKIYDMCDQLDVPRIEA